MDLKKLGDEMNDSTRDLHVPMIDAHLDMPDLTEQTVGLHIKTDINRRFIQKE